MKSCILIIVAALLAAALFPPADYVVPAEQGMQMGAVRTADLPEHRTGAGFVFIGEIGGLTQIRFAQWMVELGVIVASGVILNLVVSRGSASVRPPLPRQ